MGEKFKFNDLPITIIAADELVFPVRKSQSVANPPSIINPWERLNDYGIGLLRKPGRGELRQAEEVFRRVELLGRVEGPLNLARVYIREGRLEMAAAALRRAAQNDPPAYPWSLAYFTGIVNQQNGFLEEAIANFKSIIETRFNLARQREFDFSKDYRLLNRLAQTLL
jgi:tetratricopeptide (TPR) repeat protein